MRRPSFLSTDPTAARVVPATGFTAALTIVSSAATAFLAVFAIALSLAAGDLATRWETELAGTATVRLPAADEGQDVQVATILEALKQTPGIGTAHRLDDGEQAALLAPWFGTDLPLDSLRLPILIEVTEIGDGPDVEGLNLRLEAEAPGAVYDNHGRWRAPLAEAAGWLRKLGTVSLILIAGVMAVTIALAASAALAANGQVIDVLRLVGARDAWITRAFVQRFTLRAAAGAGAGTLIGMIALLLMPGGAETGILAGLGLSGVEWLWPLVIPPAAALLAYAATRAAAARRLGSAP
ncbi:cell division protein FtsX [Silicimonas algicola]|uniref:Cell division transport system permease protein n=1 Tax=Silicimonas algicola TaxID=1826607 RepID=A0A316G097_9RHOB|nr:cell division protein FtsX [Silicimonas algicola]AZQ69029.1 cell division protein FtsX [Silicimonas algicola]PWK54083.1 cell division transport system permease protein [Silicimonas algicola]